MRIHANSVPTIALVLTLLGLAGCSQDQSSGRLNPVAPGAQAGLDGSAAQGSPPQASRDRDDSKSDDFDPHDFVAKIDNPYFPLIPGTVFTYKQETDEGVATTKFEVTRGTKMVLGVRTTIIHDQVFVNGSLREDTYDLHAQDDDGNVWYFGEDTKEYENGVVVSTEGTWEAGRDGALPGIIMQARPRVGLEYAQENAPGVAEDRARIVGLNKRVTVPYGRFTRCLKIIEWSALAPDVREYKYYAPGVGLVLVTAEDGSERDELKSIRRR